jgi:hypothetical protein
MTSGRLPLLARGYLPFSLRQPGVVNPATTDETGSPRTSKGSPCAGSTSGEVFFRQHLTCDKHVP